MNELEDYYNNHFKDEYLPEFNELSAEYKKELSDSLSFAAYRFNKEATIIINLFKKQITDIFKTKQHD